MAGGPGAGSAENTQAAQSAAAAKAQSAAAAKAQIARNLLGIGTNAPLSEVSGNYRMGDFYKLDPGLSDWNLGQQFSGTPGMAAANMWAAAGPNGQASMLAYLKAQGALTQGSANQTGAIKWLTNSLTQASKQGMSGDLGAYSNKFGLPYAKNDTTTTRARNGANIGSYDPALGVQLQGLRDQQIASVYDKVSSAADSWGLSKLDGQIMDWTKQYGDPVTVMNLVRQSQDYQTAFQGLAERQKADPSFTEGQYLNVKQGYYDAASAQGLPKDLLNPENIGKMIAGNVSAVEFQNRVIKGYDVVKQADPAAKAELKAYYGWSEADFLHHLVDPNFTAVKAGRKAEAISAGGFSKEVGLGEIGKQGAQFLGRNIAGGGGAGQVGQYSRNQVQNALTAAAKNTPLERTAVGQDQPTANQAELIGSQISGYAGTNMAEAQKAVQKASQARLAPFQKGGGYGETNQGVTGLGSAPQ